MPALPKRLATGLLGSLVLAVLVIGFLAELHADDGRWQLTSAARLQETPLASIEPAPRYLGHAISQAAERSEPWASFDRREIRAGRLPLWNPWSGAGRPHLANAGTSTFSPFALPNYLFGARTGADVSVALELLAIGLFTFLFLLELRLSPIAALAGATAFAFAGCQFQGLATERAGAFAAIPAALLFAEKALRRLRPVAVGSPVERRSTARVRGPLAGLCLVLAIGALCGNPGALVVATSLLAVWIGARLLTIAIATRAAGRPMRPLAVFAGKTALALALAAGFVSFRILGWIELLLQADGSSAPSQGLAAIRLAPWPLFFFPRAFGETQAFEILPVHVGAFVLFLAVLALVHARREPRIAFFLAIGLFGLAAASGAAPILAKLAALGVPGEELGQSGWAFCVACAAAIAVDRVARPETPRSWLRSSLVAVAGLAWLAAFRLGVERIAEARGATLASEFAAAAPHLRERAVVFAAGLVALCLLAVARGERTRLAAGAALVLSVFLGSGRALADSIPRCEQRAAFALTPSIQALQKKVGQDRLVVLGEEGLPPDANLAYEIAVLTSRGGTEIEPYGRLFRDSFDAADGAGPITAISETALRLFGVRWVLARDPSDLARPADLALRPADPARRPEIFERVDTLGEFGLYRYSRSPGKCWLVRRSTRVESVAEALALVRDPAFDPERLVVLGPDDGARAAPLSPDGSRASVPLVVDVTLGSRIAELPRATDPPPRIVEETPTWIRMEANCSAAEFLVLAQTRYPGWSARVNGVERTLLRANAAFSGVELERGWNVVEIAYEPASFELGLWIAIACGLVGLLCLFHRPFA